MRLPNNKQRLLILGRTGSGKTVAGIWHLSKRNYNEMPWIIFNQKGDELIDSIPGTTELSLTDKIPDYPGIYIVRPIPDMDDDALDDLVQRCWAKGHVGLYFDEGYMIPGNSRGIRLVQTQGRSLRVPTIILSQRPVWLDRFIFSEADFIQRFHLNDKRDMKPIAAFMPEAATQELGEYHSWYFDVGKAQLNALAPVPDEATILNSFNIHRKKKTIFA